VIVCDPRQREFYSETLRARGFNTSTIEPRLKVAPPLRARVRSSAAPHRGSPHGPGTLLVRPRCSMARLADFPSAGPSFSPNCVPRISSTLVALILALVLLLADPANRRLKPGLGRSQTLAAPGLGHAAAAGLEGLLLRGCSRPLAAGISVAMV